MRSLKWLNILLLLGLTSPALADIEMDRGACVLDLNKNMTSFQLMMNPTGNTVGLMVVDDGRYDPIIRAYNLESCKFIASGDLKRSPIREKLLDNNYVEINAEEVLSPALNALVNFEKPPSEIRKLEVRYQYNSPEEQQILKQLILITNLRSTAFDANKIARIADNRTLQNPKFTRALFKNITKDKRKKKTNFQNVQWANVLANINLYAAAYNQVPGSKLRSLIMSKEAQQHLNELIIAGVNNDNLQNPAQIIRKYLQPIKNLTQDVDSRYNTFKEGIEAAIVAMMQKHQQKTNGINFYQQYQQVVAYAQQNFNFDSTKALGKLFVKSEDYKVLAKDMSSNLISGISSLSQRPDFKLLQKFKYKIEIEDNHDYLEIYVRSIDIDTSANIAYKHPVACHKTVLNRKRIDRTSGDGTIYGEVIARIRENCKIDNSADRDRFISTLARVSSIYGFKYDQKLPSATRLGDREYNETIESVAIGVNDKVRHAYDQDRLNNNLCAAQRGQCLSQCQGFYSYERRWQCEYQCREITCN